MTECTTGVPYTSTQPINLWCGWKDGNYSNTAITNSGYTYVNYNTNGGNANEISSLKNYCNRFLFVYKNQNGWNAPAGITLNGTYYAAYIIMPGSSVQYMPSAWNDVINSAAVDADPVTADHFMQIVGNDTNITGLYQTNFYSLSDTDKVSLTQSISNNNCTNGYASQGGTGSLYSSLVLAASLYGHETAWQSLVETGAGSYGPSGTYGITTNTACYQNLTDLSMSANSWLKNIVQDSNGNLNSVGCSAIQAYANTGTNLSNAVCLAILNDTGSYGTSYANGNSLLSSNYVTYCTGSNLASAGCEQFCGKSNVLCQNAVVNWCQGTANAANQTSHPNICGCFIPPVFDASVPLALQQLITANPKCFLSSCLSSFQLSTWGTCDVNIQECINTQNIQLAGGSTVQQLSIKNSTACQQTVSAAAAAAATTASTTTSTTASNLLTNVETFLQTEWFYSSIVLGVLLLFMIYLMYTMLFVPSTDDQILSLLNKQKTSSSSSSSTNSVSTSMMLPSSNQLR